MTPQEERDLLVRLRPWLRDRARSLLPYSEHRHIDDLAAEAWVAVWRETRTGNLDEPWLKAVARNRMLNWIRDELAAPQRGDRNTTYLDDMTTVWDGEQAVGDVEWAYHHGQIAAAVNALHPTQREYVYLRFWRGWEASRLNAHFQVANTSYLWARARPKLRDSLAHLAPELEYAP